MIKDLHSEILMLLRKQRDIIEKNYFLFDWTKTLQKFLSLYISADGNEYASDFNR